MHIVHISIDRWDHCVAVECQLATHQASYETALHRNEGMTARRDRKVFTKVTETQTAHQPMLACASVPMSSGSLSPVMELTSIFISVQAAGWKKYLWWV